MISLITSQTSWRGTAATGSPCLWAVTLFMGIGSSYKVQSMGGSHHGCVPLHRDSCPRLTWPEMSRYIMNLLVSHGLLVFSRKDQECEVGSWAISLAIPSQLLFSPPMLRQTWKNSLSNHHKQANQNCTRKYLGVQISKYRLYENKSSVFKA